MVKCEKEFAAKSSLGYIFKYKLVRKKVVDCVESLKIIMVNDLSETAGRTLFYFDVLLREERKCTLHIHVFPLPINEVYLDKNHKVLYAK